MTTFLQITLAVVLAINVWLLIAMTRQMRNNAKKLRERIDEFNNATDMHVVELQGAKHRVEEAISNTAVLKKQHDELLKEHESLFREYSALKKAHENWNITTSQKDRKDHPVEVKEMPAEMKAEISRISTANRSCDLAEKEKPVKKQKNSKRKPK